MRAGTLPGELVQALLRRDHDPGTVIRVARTALGWNQGELGRRCGYSASQISRWEKGRASLRDVAVLRTVAAVLGLPAAVFGLSDTGIATGAASRDGQLPSLRVARTGSSRREEDEVRRRTFLIAAGLAGTSSAWLASAAAAGQVDPALMLARELGDVLLQPPVAGIPVEVVKLRAALTAAQQAFAACEYVPLASALPHLLTAAEATAAERGGADARQVLAQAYNLTTRALIKLEASGLEWVAADRGLQAARAVGDPLTLAESQRLVASVARRSGDRRRAEHLTLAAADVLDTTGSAPAAAHLAMYATLYCSAAYTAAQAGDRSRADELLTEADTATTRLAQHPQEHRALIANLVSHRVSTAYALGDAGAALAHASRLPLAAIPTVERRARLLVDVALAYAQWGKPERAYASLITAERAAPGEVRTRNAVRRLVSDLSRTPGRSGLPGLPALAARVHVGI